MMDRSSAYAYVNAKAGGMLTKSFVGPRASKLFSVHTLPELWSLLFSSEVPAVPEVMLAEKIEQEALKNFIGQYEKLLSAFSHPDDISVALLQFYDFDNLKQIGAALSNKEKNMPVLADVAPYNTLKYSAWPDIAAITAGTPLSWYNRAPEISEQQTFDNRLDLQYLRTIWRAVMKLPASEKGPVQHFIEQEYTMKNILWALRLKVYYNMKPEDIIPRLASVDRRHGKRDSFVYSAKQILNKDITSWTDWSGWKYARLLNPHEEGAVWTIDPRWVEQKARIELNNEAMSLFHKYPLTVMVLVAWFKIKQNELDCIRTATESLRLNADQAQAMEFAGVGKSRQE